MATVQAKSSTPAAWWKGRNFLIGSGIAALALAGGATFALWPQSVEKQVAALAEKSPEEIRQAMESGQVPREVGWEAMGEVREREMQQRMDAYFALKTDAERDRYLDTLINEMQARQREWQERAATRPSGEWRRDRGPRGDGPATQPSAEQRAEREKRRAARADSVPPTQRAQRVEFMAAMRKRMQERGIQAPGGPGGGRGFGFGGGGGPRGGR